MTEYFYFRSKSPEKNFKFLSCFIFLSFKSTNVKRVRIYPSSTLQKVFFSEMVLFPKPLNLGCRIELKVDLATGSIYFQR